MSDDPIPVPHSRLVGFLLGAGELESGAQ